MATRLNAQLLRAIFADLCNEPVVYDPTQCSDFSGQVLVAAGWKPGFSTDRIEPYPLRDMEKSCRFRSSVMFFRGSLTAVFIILTLLLRRIMQKLLPRCLKGLSECLLYIIAADMRASNRFVCWKVKLIYTLLI